MVGGPEEGKTRDCVPFDNKLKNLQRTKMKIYLRSSHASASAAFLLLFQL